MTLLSRRRQSISLACFFLLSFAFALGQGTAPQTIQLFPVSDQVYGVAPFQIIALTSSNLPINLSVAGPASLKGRLLTVTGVGQVTITATQAGNADYAPASAQESFNIKPDVPAVQWNPGSIVYGTSLDSNILNASATATPVPDPAADTPTVTYQFNTSALTGGTQPTVLATSSAFRYEGPPTYDVSGGGVRVESSIYQEHSNLISFTCDCQQFESVVQSVSGFYRIWIDGAWTTDDAIQNDNHFPETAFYKISFPDKRPRQIRLLYMGRPVFYGVITTGDDSVSPPQIPIGPKFVSFGDSWSGPTIVEPYLPPNQPGVAGSGFGQKLGEYFNWDWWESGLGGSGFIVTAYPAQPNFVVRAQTDLCATNPDIVLVMGGINDGNQALSDEESAATHFFTNLTSCLPNATIFFAGPQVTSPIEPALNATAAKFKNQIYYVDPEAENWFYGSDSDPSTGNLYEYINEHPTPLGHDFLAEKVANFILKNRPDLLPKTFPLFSPAPANGTFSYSAAVGTLLPAGSNQISATFTPQDTANYATTTQTATLTVSKATTSLALATNSSTAIPGVVISLAAMVSPQIAGVPTGSVTFLDNGSPIGSVAPDGSGKAVLNISTLPAGSHSIAASYGGDGNFLPSTSTTSLSVLISQPDFSFSVDTPQVTVNPTWSTTINLLVVPVSGLVANLNLSCSGLPTGAGCELGSGAQVAINQQNVKVPVIIHGFTPKAALKEISFGLPGAELCGLFGLSFVLRRRNRKIFSSVNAVALLLVASSIALTGCGSSSKITTAQPGTYNVQVTLTNAANPSMTHSQNITVTIP